MFRSIVAVLVMVVLAYAGMGCDENRTTNASPRGDFSDTPSTKHDVATPENQPGVPPAVTTHVPEQAPEGSSPKPDAMTIEGRKALARNAYEELRHSGLRKEQIEAVARALDLKETMRSGALPRIRPRDDKSLDAFLGEESGTAAKRREEFEALPEEEKEVARQRFIAEHGNPYSEAERE